MELKTQQSSQAKPQPFYAVKGCRRRMYGGYEESYKVPRIGELINGSKYPDPTPCIYAENLFVEPIERPSVMTRLEEAANVGDERAFINILQGIEWKKRDVEEAVTAIKLALNIGRPTAAQHIYAEALKYHADAPSLRKYARLFAQSRQTSSTSQPNPTLQANREWLKLHRSKYRGQWIAVRSGELMATANSLEELIKLVGDTKNVLLTRA